MDELLHFDDLQIGQCWKSTARTVTETDVVNFAGLTGDYDPLHMDHEFARKSHFGKPIAHGILGLALVAGQGSHWPRVRTDAFIAIHDWKFLKPIYFGDTVHVLTEVVDKGAGGRRRGNVCWRRQLINQHGDVVQEGIFETLVGLSHVEPPPQVKAGHRTPSSVAPASATEFVQLDR